MQWGLLQQSVDWCRLQVNLGSEESTWKANINIQVHLVKLDWMVYKTFHHVIDGNTDFRARVPGQNSTQVSAQ